MTVRSKVLVQGKRVEAAPTVQYTSTNLQSILDAATATNTTAAARLFSAWLVPSGGAVSDANKVIDGVSIAAHDTYLCPELAGRRLDAGDTLHCECDAADSVSLRVDGRQVTA